MKLYRAERPLAFLTGIALALAIVSVGLAMPIVVTYLETGLVPRLPTAVLSTGLMLVAFSGARALRYTSTSPTAIDRLGETPIMLINHVAAASPPT